MVSSKKYRAPKSDKSFQCHLLQRLLKYVKNLQPLLHSGGTKRVVLFHLSLQCTEMETKIHLRIRRRQRLSRTASNDSNSLETSRNNSAESSNSQPTCAANAVREARAVSSTQELDGLGWTEIESTNLTPKTKTCICSIHNMCRIYIYVNTVYIYNIHIYIYAEYIQNI